MIDVAFKHNSVSKTVFIFLHCSFSIQRPPIFPISDWLQASGCLHTPPEESEAKRGLWESVQARASGVGRCFVCPVLSLKKKSVRILKLSRFLSHTVREREGFLFSQKRAAGHTKPTLPQERTTCGWVAVVPVDTLQFAAVCAIPKQSLTWSLETIIICHLSYCSLF